MEEHNPFLQDSIFILLFFEEMTIARHRQMLHMLFTNSIINSLSIKYVLTQLPVK